MAKTRALKSRLKAVANIRRITKTMQMIATNKFAKAQQRALAAKPYTEGIFELARTLAATAGGEVDHPLLKGPGASAKPGEPGGATAGGPGAGGGSAPGKAPELWLVIASERGLCGAYNGSVLRAGLAEYRASPRPILTELAGKKGAAILKFAKIAVNRQHAFGDNPRREEIDRLAEEYMARFTSGEVSAVRVVFMRFLSAGRQKPEVLQLLPLRPIAAAPKRADAQGAARDVEHAAAEGAGRDEAAAARGVAYEFSPPAPELLAELLPVTVRATLNQCFNDALVSEHVMRMVAMKAATDNAGKMGKLLTRKYNRARQGQITTELTEIISGAQALE